MSKGKNTKKEVKKDAVKTTKEKISIWRLTKKLGKSDY